MATDTAAILQRVEKIEAFNAVRRKAHRGASLSDTEWLCQQLRTALADIRRVEMLETLYEAACDWFNYGPPHMIDETDPGSIVTGDGGYEPMTKALEDAVSAISIARSATPREKGPVDPPYPPSPMLG